MQHSTGRDNLPHSLAVARRTFRLQAGLLLFNRSTDFESGLTLFAMKIIKRHGHLWYQNPALATAGTFGQRGKVGADEFADDLVDLAQVSDGRLLRDHVVDDYRIALYFAL